MAPLKRAVKKLVQRFGFDLVRGQAQNVRMDNFSSLATAYEYQLNRGPSPACPPGNALRTRLLARLLGTPPAQAYAIISCLARTAALEGDVCEFGVAQGESSALIANEIAPGDRILHLFDSFEGLPAPSSKDELKDDIFSLGSMEAYRGTMACREEMVLGRLRDIGFPPHRYRIHKGFIEDLIAAREGFPAAVAFAYVDFDFYEPIRIALDFLETALVPGAIAMVDDYDFFSTGAKTAVQEFLARVNAAGPAFDLEIADPQLGHFALLTRREPARTGAGSHGP